MKRICVALFVIIIFCVSLGYIQFSIYKNIANKKESNEILKLAYEKIQNSTLNIKQEHDDKNVEKLVEKNQFVNVEYIKNEQINIEGDIIGILRIPVLNIEAPIKEGTSQEIMHTSIGHFIESDFWDGNVSLASHNSGTSAHYFENINKLNLGDEIVYITQYGARMYKVESVNKIKSTDWSMVNSTGSKENTITLITCISFKPDYRLCVRAVEVN